MGRSLPSLMQLYTEFKDQRDQFEILAFHDNKAANFEEFDERCKAPKEKHWGGKDLPFPILLDATGDTIRSWGIRAFPTVLLIDPDGKLVQGGGERMLRQLLKEKQPAVLALVEKLRRGKINEIAGDANAPYAIQCFLRQGAKPEQAPALFAVLAQAGTRGALMILGGEHGLGSEDIAFKKAALAAIQDFAKRTSDPSLKNLAEYYANRE